MRYTGCRGYVTAGRHSRGRGGARTVSPGGRNVGSGERKERGRTRYDCASLRLVRAVLVAALR